MSAQTFLDGKVTLLPGDCREVLAGLPEASIDAIVCDPPYGLGFMGKKWDTPGALVERKAATENKWDHVGGNHNPSNSADAARTARVEGKRFGEWCETWAREALRVLKPGGHVVAFSGTRTYHRLACAIEDAGFEIRDQLAWVYGSGFPKSMNVAKAIESGGGRPEDIRRMQMGAGYTPSGRGRVNYDHGGGSAMNGTLKDYTPNNSDAAQWSGWGTALKPAWEPIVLARKPLIGTVAANVLKHGTGAINVDGCRIETSENLNGGGYGGSQRHDGTENWRMRNGGAGEFRQPAGRFPANLLHDGSPEVLAGFPETHVAAKGPNSMPGAINCYGDGWTRQSQDHGSSDGSAARFFYTAKADQDDRLGSRHPTVKPVDLMQWLVRLVTPKGGTTLDPFAGTGTTGEAAWREGMKAILIEREPEYQADIARRMDLAAKPTKRAAVAASKNNLKGHDDLPLFGGE